MEKRYDYITPKDYITAEINGISPELLEQRVRERLWDIDRAITTPKKQRKCFEKAWDEWGEIAISNGITRANFVNRVGTLGWNEKDASTVKPEQARSHKEWTDEERKLAEKNGLSANHLSLVKTRINKLGWSRERALNTPKMSLEEQAKRIGEGTRAYYERRKKDVNYS